MIRKLLITILFAFIFGLLLRPTFAFEIELPEPVGFINDFENIIDDETERSLELKLSDFQKETSTEIAVVTVSSFGRTTIEDYAEKLFQKWGIGTSTSDNGVLILVSSSQRESRIEVGYGLEGALPDAMTGRIQDNEMIPYFAEGNYSKGIENGVNAVMSAASGETFYVPPVQDDTRPAYFLLALLLLPFLIIIFTLIAFTKNWWLGGVMGGLLGIMVRGLIGGIVGGLIGLLIDYVLSQLFGKMNLPKGPTTSSPRPRSSSVFTPSIGRSSSSFGGGSRSSGFGGFSGGRSGGGGSSRKW